MKVILVCREKKVDHILKQGLEESGFAVEHYEDLFDGFIELPDYSNCLLLYDLPFEHDNDDQDDRLCLLSEKVPVIILTGDNHAHRWSANEEGSKIHYLAKPFMFAELLAMIRSLIETIP